MGLFSSQRWGGTHSEFVRYYESYLDAIYRSESIPSPGNGRWILIRSISTELRQRKVKTVLDCAVGTGFPALDLARAPSLPNLKIHCTDADLEMLRILEEQVKLKDYDIGLLAPPRRDDMGYGSLESLLLNWSELGQIETTYDYVMCRGNSLAYADSWTGGKAVAPTTLIRQHLENMKARVRPGGHLHVDAPWRLDLPEENYRSAGDVAIWEQVNTESDRRQWRVVFKPPDRRRLEFQRYSTCLTIHDLKDILDDIGFELTEPFQLVGERAGFGVIIARKPN